QQRNANVACAVNLEGTSDEALPATLTDLVEAWRAADDLQGKAKDQPAGRGALRRNAAADGVATAHERLKKAVEAAVDAGGRDAGAVPHARHRTAVRRALGGRYLGGHAERRRRPAFARHPGDGAGDRRRYQAAARPDQQPAGGQGQPEEPEPDAVGRG